MGHLSRRIPRPAQSHGPVYGPMGRGKPRRCDGLGRATARVQKEVRKAGPCGCGTQEQEKEDSVGSRLDVPMAPVPAVPRRTRGQDDSRGSPPPTRVLEAQRGVQWHLQERPSWEHPRPGQPQWGPGGLFGRALVWKGMGKGCRASDCPP